MLSPDPMEEFNGEIEWFIEREVLAAIKSCKDRKACGPDGIFNEHIKQLAPKLGKTITSLFNKCLQQGRIPENWRRATVKMLYKGKGDTGNPNNYRSIALECTLFKILTGLITNRLSEKAEDFLPEEQFGFRKGRSTLQALHCLQNDIETTLSRPEEKLHAIFIDLNLAFDTINRKILIEKLETMIGTQNYLCRIIKNILSDNCIEVNDDITRSKPIKQNIGVLQGDPLSPLLFILATADATKSVTSEDVKSYIYADDMVIVSSSQEKLQNAYNNLVDWVERNKLTVNENKTVSMSFRRGGKQALFYHKSRPLTTVTHFKYLGVVFQTPGNVFTLHVKERAVAAVKAMNDIKKLSKLSFSTAIKLFHAMISPIATYGLENIWIHLTKRQVAELEKVKATYLKKAMCLFKYTPNRMVYILAREQFYIEELRFTMLLPNTKGYEELLQEMRQKRDEVWSDFYGTDAMASRDWMQCNYELRHVMTRFAVHGFHHQICVIARYHQPGPGCECKRCGKVCERYHVMTCGQREESLTKFGS